MDETISTNKGIALTSSKVVAGVVVVVVVVVQVVERVAVVIVVVRVKWLWRPLPLW